MRIKTKAIYENGILRPVQDIGLVSGEEVEIEIGRRMSVRSTRGIIDLDRDIAKDIADSDECTFLEE